MLIHSRTALLTVATLLIAAFGVIGCEDDDNGDDETPTAAAVQTPGAGGGDNTVAVELREWSVIPAQESAPAGSITFAVTNIGPTDPHEFVVIRSDLAPDALPTDDQGAVPEDEVDLVDELEEIEVDESGELTVDLEAGSYVLICNLVEEEDGEVEAHYSLGMRSAFTVE
jgi:hypothetical protein